MVVERFLGLKHVADTTSSALKKALLDVLAEYGFDRIFGCRLEGGE